LIRFLEITFKELDKDIKSLENILKLQVKIQFGFTKTRKFYLKKKIGGPKQKKTKTGHMQQAKKLSYLANDNQL
jgi:hypothetical protein